MDEPPNEFEDWFLANFDNAVGMVKERLKTARTAKDLARVRDIEAPEVLARFRKMYGKGLAAEADARMAAARQRIEALIAEREAELTGKGA